MIELISFLVTLAVVAIVVWGVFWFVDNVLKLPANINQIIKVIVSIIAVVWLVIRYLPGVTIG